MTIPSAAPGECCMAPPVLFNFAANGSPIEVVPLLSALMRPLGRDGLEKCSCTPEIGNVRPHGSSPIGRPCEAEVSHARALTAKPARFPACPASIVPV